MVIDHADRLHEGVDDRRAAKGEAFPLQRPRHAARHLRVGDDIRVAGVRVGRVQEIGITATGAEVKFDLVQDQAPDDLMIERDGARVVVDPVSLGFVLGSEIDFETSRLSSKFVFRNPNQTDACGCGESVTIVPAQAES